MRMMMRRMRMMISRMRIMMSRMRRRSKGRQEENNKENNE
jgi:hypothetical protein